MAVGLTVEYPRLSRHKLESENCNGGLFEDEEVWEVVSAVVFEEILRRKLWALVGAVLPAPVAAMDKYNK
jgi:hypothetical protein